MTDTEYDDTNDDDMSDDSDHGDDKLVPVSQVRHLAAKAKKADEAAARALAAERELAVYRSGLSLNDRQRQALLAVAGDNLDTGHLKSLASDLFGVADESEPAVPAEQLDGEARVRAALAGGGDPDVTDPLAFIKSASDGDFMRWLGEQKYLPEY